jgi:predicted unusual protein kinase regulating ubiquinone biosynthesis (AarF/ABC1/UbiB family)
MSNNLLTRTIEYADLARHARTLRQSSDDQVRQNARSHLVARMGKLRGLPQKIGQIISMAGDGQDNTEFDALTDRADALAFDEIRPVIEKAWGKSVASVVTTINEEGLAASLGQVHRATLHDGREVAIKVRYPGIRKAVMHDLRVLGWLSAPLGDLRRGFDLGEYRQVILEDIEQELDYRIEAEHQKRYGRLMSGLSEWVVPKVIDELSTDSVLVSEWVEGQRIETAADWTKSDRDALASSLLQGFFHMLFDHGMIHADPHPGNYRFAKTDTGPKIILYDYGSVATFSDRDRVALLKLIAMTTDRSGDPFSALVSMGFNPDLLSPIRGKLAALCTVLFEPFTQRGKFDTRGWQLGERSDAILGDDRWNFRMSGPAGMILVLRAFRGLIYYLEKLDTDAWWSGRLAPVMARHAAELNDLDLSEFESNTNAFDTLANHLRIAVFESGRTKVALTFPASSVDRLEDLIDRDLMARIRQQNIDVDELILNVRRSAYEPQTLFSLDESPGTKGVRVWLE